MKSLAIVLLLGAVVMTAGCVTADRVRGHILQPTDRVLPNYQDNLVILDVRVVTDGDPLKLNAMQLRHTGTGEPWRLALFSNVFLKTQALPFEERDDGIHHTIVVDLPEGTYEVQSAEFQNFVVNLAGTNVAQSLEQALDEPLFFEVTASSSPQYLGELEFRIRPTVVSQSRDGTSTMLGAADKSLRDGNRGLEPGGTDAMVGAAAAAVATDVQTMTGRVDVLVTPPVDATTAGVGRRFRVLSGTTVIPGKMWIQSNDSP